MTDKKCSTDCREDLLCRIGKAVTKAGVWKFIGVGVVAFGILWSASYTIFAKGAEKRDNAIEKNQTAVADIKEKTASIKSDVEYIKKAQEKIESQNFNIMMNLRVIADKLEDGD